MTGFYALESGPQSKWAIDQNACTDGHRSPTTRISNAPETGCELTKSKQRIADHGEVFTPDWMVNAMLDQVKGESERIDSRFLEPACGSGNFLIRVLQRKLATVELKYGGSDFERRHYALLALMCIYGIELLADNVSECRANMLAIVQEYLNGESCNELHEAARYVLSVNLILGDALAMRTADDSPIIFAEWGYLGAGKFQRRDFRLDILAQSKTANEQTDLLTPIKRQEIFAPVKSYAPMTMREISASTITCRARKAG